MFVAFNAFFKFYFSQVSKNTYYT